MYFMPTTVCHNGIFGHFMIFIFSKIIPAIDGGKHVNAEIDFGINMKIKKKKINLSHKE